MITIGIAIGVGVTVLLQFVIMNALGSVQGKQETLSEDVRRGLLRWAKSQEEGLLLSEAVVAHSYESRNNLAQLSYDHLREETPDKHPTRSECRRTVNAVFEYLKKKEPADFLASCRAVANS